MLIDSDFEVPVPIDRTWAYLLDVQKVAPCAPGAEITETVDERTWKGRLKVKLGPVSLAFAGTVTIQDRDDAGRRIVLLAKGQETKGKGAATATVTTWLEEGGAGTVVKMQSDVSLTGSVAQLSRGLLPDVSRRLTAQFAECLRTSIAEDETPTAPAAAPGPSEPAAEAGLAPPTPPATPTAGGPAGAQGPVLPSGPTPIGGIRLALWAIWRAIVRSISRLFGRR